MPSRNRREVCKPLWTVVRETARRIPAFRSPERSAPGYLLRAAAGCLHNYRASPASSSLFTLPTTNSSPPYMQASQMSPPHMQDFFVSHFDYTSENETRFQQLDPSPYRLSAHDYISRLTPSNMFPPGSINAKTPFWATIPIRAYSEDPSPPLLQVFRHPKLVSVHLKALL